ncbi:MAG: glycosyltransferase family 4 protein [Candidatus Binatia bacterium]
MKVCALTDSLDPSNGPGRCAAELIRVLKGKLASLDVVIPAAHGPVADDVANGCNLHRLLPSRHFFYLRRALFYPAVLGNALRIVPMVRRVDVVHALKDYPFSLVAAVAAALCRKPLIVTAHGTFSVLPLRSWPDRPLARFVFRRAAKILSVSRYTRDRLAEFIGDEKILVIHNGVDARSFQARSARAPAGDSNAPFVLGVGQIKQRKGFDLSVRAFCRIAPDFPGLVYLLAGEDGDTRDVGALRALIESEPEGARVRLLGKVDESELAWLYRNCELFVLTPRADSAGRFEGFGLVYLEAGAFGKAVIGSRDSGAEDAIVDGETGLLVRADVEDVARALRSLLEDRGLADRLGRRGKLRAESLSWERVGEAVLGVYSTVTGGSS